MVIVHSYLAVYQRIDITPCGLWTIQIPKVLAISRLLPLNPCFGWNPNQLGERVPQTISTQGNPKKQSCGLKDSMCLGLVVLLINLKSIGAVNQTWEWETSCKWRFLIEKPSMYYVYINIHGAFSIAVSFTRWYRFLIWYTMIIHDLPCDCNH